MIVISTHAIAWYYGNGYDDVINLRYKELMRQCLKYIPASHPDHSDALQALDIVRNVAQHANQTMRDLVSLHFVLN